MGSLTEIRLRAMLRARKPIAGISDGEGLTWTLSLAGKASWILRYRLAGKQRELTLGSYPDISLQQARKNARAARAQIDTGTDVAAEKRKSLLALAASASFTVLAEDYLERGATALVERSQREIRRHLGKDVFPRIGHIPAREVCARDIVEMIGTVAKRSPSVARRIYEVTSVVFAHGVAKGMLRQNPCTGLRIASIIGPVPKRRQRIKLTDEELRKFVAALPMLGDSNALALRILLATCVRKGELIRARWADVDLDAAIWRIPDENSKAGRGFSVPLSQPVVGWFKVLKALAGLSDWVLPSRRSKIVPCEGHMSDKTFNAALKRLDCAIRDISPHDLRSTARSHLAALGIDLIVAERCLNHSLGGLVAVYDQHDYLTERRKALDLWAAHIEELERVKSPTAVSFFRLPVAA